MSRPAATDTTPETTLLSSDPSLAKKVGDKAQEDLSIAEEELASLTKRLGIDTTSGTPDLDTALAELEEVNRQLALASDVTYSGDIQGLLEKLVVAQSRLNVALKSTQISYLKSIIATCAFIRSDVDAKRLFSIPTHVKALNLALARLETMPSLADFENENAKLARLVTLVSPRVVDESVLRTPQYHRSSALIAQAFARSAAPMLTFIENWKKAEGELSPIPESSRMSLTTREEVTRNITSVVESSIKNKSDAVALLQSQNATITAEIERINLEIAESTRLVAKLEKSIAKVTAARAAQTSTLEENTRTTAKKQKPKPFSFGRFFGRVFNTKTYRTTVERERKEIADLASEATRLTLEIEAKRQEIELKQQEKIAKKLELEARQQAKKDKEAEKEKKQNEIDVLNFAIETAKKTLGTIKEVSESPLERPDSVDQNFSELVAETKSYSGQLGRDPVIQRMAAEKAAQDAKRAEKIKAFEAAIKTRFHRAFTIAQLVKEGAVKLPSDMVDTGLSATRGIVELISVPGVQQGLLALVGAAKLGNKIRKRIKSNRVRDFGAEDDSHDIVDEIARVLSESYTHQIDGDSPLDHLSEEGLKAFATTIVDQTITSISERRPPWKTKEAEVAAAAASEAVTESEKAVREKVVDEIVEELEKELEIDPEETEENLSKKIAHGIVGCLLEGKDRSRTTYQLMELTSKKRFADNQMENSEIDAKWNVEGLLRRVGIVTASGERYVSTSRKEGKSGEGSKYGWRLATPAEERKISKAKAAASAASVLKGYEKFTSARETFTQKRSALLSTLNEKDFSDPAQFAKREELLDALIEEYATKKQRGAKAAELNHILKSNEFLKVGKSHRTYTLSTNRDDDRLRFNELKKMIAEAGEALYHAKVAEAPKVKTKSETTRKVLKGLAAVGAVTVAAGGLAKAVIDGDLDEVGEHIIEGVGSVVTSVSSLDADRLRAGAETLATRATEAVATTAADSASAIADAADAERVAVRGTLSPALRTIFDNTDAALQTEAQIRSGIAMLKEYFRPADIKLHETQLTQLFQLCVRAQDVLESAEKDGIKITKASRRMAGYEDILKTSDPDGYYLRVKRNDDGEIIDLKLFKSHSMSKANEVPLFDEGKGGLKPECKIIIDRLFAECEKTVTRKKVEKMVDDARAGTSATIARIHSVASAESVELEEEDKKSASTKSAFKEGDHSKESLMSLLQGMLPALADLSAAVTEIGGTISDKKNMIGTVTGKTIKMPAVAPDKSSEEKAPTYLVVELDNKGKVANVSLCGGDREDRKRQLFDGKKVKDKHALTTIPHLLERYSEMLSKYRPSTAVKDPTFAPLAGRGHGPLTVS